MIFSNYFRDFMSFKFSLNIISSHLEYAICVLPYLHVLKGVHAVRVSADALLVCPACIFLLLC